MPERKTPQVRFKGFTDTWEQRKLGALMDVGSVKRVHQSDWRDSGVRFLRARDVVADFNNEEPDDYLYIDQKMYEEYSAQSGKVQQGDLLVTGVGTIGIPMLIKSEKPLYFKDGNIIWFKNKNAIDGQFFYYSFISKGIQDFIKESAGIGTVGTYTIDSGKKTPINLPTSIEEQKEIGIYFKNIDHLITLHQRECERLQMVKKSMLENCFPKNGEKVPRFRFAGFTGDWKQRKLGDIADVYDGVHQTPDYQESGIMFLSVENIATLTSNKFISEEAFQRDYKSYPVKGDILMTRIGDVGTPNVVESTEKVAFYVSLALIKPKSIDSYFLCNAIRSPRFQKALRDRTLVTAIPQKINKDEIGKVEFLMPSNINEQREIGAYFHNLDHLITLHQSELEMLKKIKESMLGKMLV